MGVLLEHARKVFGSGPRELPPAEPFDISCACGRHVTGFRQDYRQFVRCPGCGHTLLVLPLSPYPKPVSYEPPARKLDIPVEVIRPKRPLGVRARIRLRRARRATGAMLWTLVPPKRWFSPVRLLMMAMLLTIAGTVWLTIYSTRRGSLAGNVVAARAAWTADLEAGDFARARSKLEQAAAAIKRYGVDSRDSREVEQLAKEVALFSDQLERSWEDVLREVRGMNPQECADFFRDKLKSPAAIFDAHVSPSPAPADGSASYRVDCKLFVGPESARLDVSDLKLFKRLSPGLSTRVLFGARIQSIERPASSEDWIIRLVPDSGSLITSLVCLEKVGWPVDDATRTLIDSQSREVLDQP